MEECDNCKKVNISINQLKEMLADSFEMGRNWGVTFSTWFIPTDEDNYKKIYEAVNEILKINRIK